MDQGSQETQRIRAAKRPVLELSPMSAMFGVVSVNAQRSSRLELHRLYFASNCVFSGWGEKDEQAGPRHLTPYTS